MFNRVALKTSLIYLIISLIWISSSDAVVEFLLQSDLISLEISIQLQTLKGFFFVIITTLLIYSLIQTESKQTEEVKNDFIRLFKENPNPMWIYDLENYRILEVNDAAIYDYGYSREEFLKKTLFDLRPPSQVAELKKHLNKNDGTDGDYSDSGVWLHQSKEGKDFFAHFYSHKTIFEEKDCRIVTAINVDHSYRTELEIKNINRALNASTYLCITNLKGEVVDLNPAYEQISGYTKAELIGKNIRILDSGTHDSSYWTSLWNTINAGEVWSGEMCSKAKNGDHFWFYSVISPIKDTEGQIIRFMSISSDISQMISMQKEKEEHLERLKEYAYLTSHDIRGPLTRLLALTDFYDVMEQEQLPFILNNVKKTSLELDQIIRKMNEKVESELEI